MYSLDIFPDSFRRHLADAMKMKKPKSRARRGYVGLAVRDSRKERASPVPLIDSLTQKPTPPQSEDGMVAATLAELIGVAGDGARLMLSAEALLKKQPVAMSVAQQEALDEIETAILLAQSRFKEIAGAARHSLPIDFEMKPEDERALNKIIEDDEKYMVAEMKNGAW